MKTITLFLIKLIKCYNYLFSPLLGQNCRYFPSCSEYSIEAIRTHGLFKGLFMSLKRILTCHPIKILGGSEGFDPVKKKINIEK